MPITGTTVWEIRTTGSDTQCSGGFNPARGGTDYSQQNTAQVTGTVTSASSVVTATTSIFTAAMVGNIITDGTTFKEIITFTNATTVSVDSSPSWTAATIYVGGALATPGKCAPLVVSNNTVNQQTGTYNINLTSTVNTPGGPVSILAGATQISWKGYAVTHGDLGAPPVFLITGYANVAAFSILSIWGILENIIVDFNGNTTLNNGNGISTITAGSRVYNCTVKGGATIGITAQIPINCLVTGCIAGQSAFFITLLAIGCIAEANLGNGFISSQDTCILNNCISYGNSGHGFVENAGITIINCTAFSNGGAGFVGAAGGRNTFVSNSIFYGNGQWGIDGSTNTSAATPQFFSCAIGGNTAGSFRGFTGAEIINQIALTVNPFVSSATGNFSLNSTSGGGALCRGVGYIGGTFPLGLTIGFPDVGAVQHQSPDILGAGLL